MTEIGEEAESVVTNSESLAKTIGKANCETCKEARAAFGEEARNQNWAIAHTQFEQHMKEEEEEEEEEEENGMRVNWFSGGLEEGRTVCRDKNAWDRSHACCNQQCNGVLNAFASFPVLGMGRCDWNQIGPSGSHLSKKDRNRVRRKEASMG